MSRVDCAVSLLISSPHLLIARRCVAPYRWFQICSNGLTLSASVTCSSWELRFSHKPRPCSLQAFLMPVQCGYPLHIDRVRTSHLRVLMTGSTSVVRGPSVSPALLELENIPLNLLPRYAFPFIHRSARGHNMFTLTCAYIIQVVVSAVSISHGFPMSVGF